MNKRLKFCISIFLVCVMLFGAFVTPASSYENDVNTSTADMLLINTDTDTVVFSQKPDNKWHLGSLSKLMTFLIAYDEIADPADKIVVVEQSFISALPYSDGCLKNYVGKKVSVKDLMAIMLLTSGSDAAYALSDIVCPRDVNTFVAKMNERAGQLGLKDTIYVSPGYSADTKHHTTCRDLYTTYMAVKKNAFFNSLMKGKKYTTIANGKEKGKKVKIETSILNEDSPYYFRYVNDAVYSYSKETYAGIALTTTYKGKSYFFAGLLGLNATEENIYADAKKLTTWAYLNLSDKKLINDDDKLSDVNVTTDWGYYRADLYPDSAGFKTLPSDYDENLLAYTFDVPKKVKTPLVTGQSVGKMKMLYNAEVIDEIDLVIRSDEGLGMVADFQRFANYVYRQLTPSVPQKLRVKATEPATQAPRSTEAASEDASAQPSEKATEG